MVLKRIITMSHYNKEMQLRKTCKLYAYVLEAQGKEVPESILECRDSDGSEEYDCLIDCVADLSQALKSFDSETFERIVKNTQVEEARELAHWWEMYQLYIPLETN
jgi:hypothetical protein